MLPFEREHDFHKIDVFATKPKFHRKSVSQALRLGAKIYQNRNKSQKNVFFTPLHFTSLHFAFFCVFVRVSKTFWQNSGQGRLGLGKEGLYQRGIPLPSATQSGTNRCKVFRSKNPRKFRGKFFTTRNTYKSLQSFFHQKSTKNLKNSYKIAIHTLYV